VTVTDRSADSLWRAHGADLLRFATLLVGPHDADDIAVKAFLGAVARASDATVRDPRAYLLGAVANHAASSRRSRERRWRRDLAGR
jgi:DNA-directed RNA polymerase specialized sigma24 family protein